MGTSNMCKNLLIIVIITTITSKNKIITTGVFFPVEKFHNLTNLFSENEKKRENSMIFLHFSRHFSK
jgi:hypothetical protein